MKRSAAPSQVAKRSKAATKKKLVPFQKQSLTRSLGLGFPKTLTSTLKYVETVSLSAPAGTVATYLFSCNGMYDPNITGTGHQPMYFDQLMGIYDHYTVLKSFIKITFFSNTENVVATLTVCDDASPNAAFVQERNPSTNRVMVTTEQEPVAMTKSWDAVKMFGGDPRSNDNLQGNSSNNPTEVSNYCIALTQPNASAISPTLVLVEIWYTAFFDELLDIAGS